MKSRVYLSVAIAAVGIAACALVFCRKEEGDDVKKSSARKPGLAPQTSPLAGQSAEGSRKIVKTEPGPKAEPEKVLTPEEEEKAAGQKAFTMFKWMTAYSVDNGGAFPPDTSALLSANLGFPTDQAGDWLRHVIDYRGRDLTNSDDGKLLLLRYRIGNRTDKEVRVYVSGSTIVVPSTDPIPEDAPQPVEAPR